VRPVSKNIRISANSIRKVTAVDPLKGQEEYERTMRILMGSIACAKYVVNPIDCERFVIQEVVKAGFKKTCDRFVYERFRRAYT
jgi:hypothetical protein